MKYRIVGVLNLFFGLTQITVPLVQIFFVLPKLFKMYDDVIGPAVMVPMPVEALSSWF